MFVLTMRRLDWFRPAFVGRILEASWTIGRCLRHRRRSPVFVIIHLDPLRDSHDRAPKSANQ